MVDYPYASILVADAVTFQRAANASVMVYDINDTGSSTPLALKDLSGLPMPNPLTSSSDAFLPAFVAQVDGVKLVGGGLTITEYSHKGMRDAAQAAAAAAQGAAGSAASAVAEVVTAAAVNGSGKLILTKATGATVDVGSVIGPAGAKGDKGADGSNVLPTQQAIAEAITNDGPAKTALSATYAGGYSVPVSTGGDDGPMLNAVLTAAAAAKLPVSFKFYTVKDTSLTLPSNVVIDGNNALIQALPGANRPVMVNSDPVNGNTNITIRNLRLDGNGINQTQQFTVAPLTKVTHSKFEGLNVQGGLRNQMFPNGTYGEGLSLILSDHNEIVGGRFHHNAYDGLKFRSSNWNRVSNVLCDDNGRAGIQLSFFSPTGPPYSVGEHVESAGSNDNTFTNVVLRHTTGTPHTTAPTTSGIYFHTAARNTFSGLKIEGFQQGIGVYGTCSDNSLSDGLILHRHGSTNRAGIDLENGTEHRNTFSNIKVRGMAGENGKLVRTIAGGTGNRFLACVFEQGAGTGAWTIENAAAGTQFLDYVSTLAITDTGTGTVIRDPRVAASADLGKPKRTDSFSAASGAIPYGWATRWNHTGATWTEDAGGYLRVVKTGNGRAALANQISGDGANVEILAKVRTSAKTSGSTPVGVVARGSGAAASENGYYLGLSTADSLSEIYIQRYSAGVSTGIGFSNAYTWAANTWVWVRFRVQASTGTPGAVSLFTKIWADGSPEPADWGISVVDNAASRVTTPGFHGAFAFSAGTSDVDTYAATILD